jgi:hypothetical protein
MNTNDRQKNKNPSAEGFTTTHLTPPLGFVRELSNVRPESVTNMQAWQRHNNSD